MHLYFSQKNKIFLFFLYCLCQWFFQLDNLSIQYLKKDWLMRFSFTKAGFICKIPIKIFHTKKKNYADCIKNCSIQILICEKWFTRNHIYLPKFQNGVFIICLVLTFCTTNCMKTWTVILTWLYSYRICIAEL